MENSIETFLKGIHNPGPASIKKIDIKEPFIDFAARFSSHPGTVVLLSGGDLDCAGYHILAARPWLIFSNTNGISTISSKTETFKYASDPFVTLRTLLDFFKLSNLSDLKDISPDFPVQSGLFGYLSYDLKDHIEKLPRTSVDDLQLPQIMLFAPELIIVYDKIQKSAFICHFVDSSDQELPNEDRDCEIILAGLSGFSGNKKKNNKPDTGFTMNGRGFKSIFTKPEYMRSIETIRKYIASGDVYQVNMSQRFETDFSGNPFDLFKALYALNPAPFFSYVNCGDHQIVSTSPERFIQRTGNSVETRPIKGTRPRHENKEEDNKYKNELLNSEKDDAELSMIVDLMRNDIGKVCKAGSVYVSEHKRLEPYQNVYHLVSVVKGTLSDEKDSVDLLKATFPGGSITGCPKIRAMEIIDELEPVRRHIYTGSVGYISFHDTMDFSIAIRTGTILNNKFIFSVGGGIVFDSDPASEFYETIHKGRTLMQVFESDEKVSCNEKGVAGSYIWINGKILHSDKAFVNVTDPGFQYGHGFFETIRTHNSEPFYLDLHISRFHDAWEFLFSKKPPDLSYKEIIKQLLSKNNLSAGTAAVKILASKGSRTSPPFDDNIIITARPYYHRLEVLDKTGLDIGIYPEARQSPLASYKTMNYLYYVLAGRWADDNGYDEAVILNPDNSVSETNTANIILLKNNMAILPESVHVLPGIMESATVNILKDQGYYAIRKKVFREDVLSADSVIMTNSLIGAVPVLSLDGIKITAEKEICDSINKQLFL